MGKIILIVYIIFGVISTTGMLFYMLPLNEKKKDVKTWVFFVFMVLPLWWAWSIFIIYQQYQQSKHKIKCAWCGEIVDFTNMDAVKEHVAVCKEHPTLTRIAELQNIIEKSPKWKTNKPLPEEVIGKCVHTISRNGRLIWPTSPFTKTDYLFNYDYKDEKYYSVAYFIVPESPFPKGYLFLRNNVFMRNND